MNYYIDTEFIEGFKKPIKWLPTIGNFNKPYHSIQLISIGIVAEDGREYYAVSNQYNYDDANDWVKENVILPIYREQIAAFKQQYMNIKTFHKYIPNGKSNKQISKEIVEFINPQLGWPVFSYNNSELKSELPLGKHFDLHNVGVFDNYYFAQPTFYGYYADYDWVLFCSLFGTMMDLPKGFPMYARDLKQELDDKAWNWSQIVEYREAFNSSEGREPSHETCLEIFKAHADYPKQTNEHNAIADAKWNKALHEFLKGLQ